jgi:hypothetical protein
MVEVILLTQFVQKSGSRDKDRLLKETCGLRLAAWRRFRAWTVSETEFDNKTHRIPQLEAAHFLVFKASGQEPEPDKRHPRFDEGTFKWFGAR